MAIPDILLIISDKFNILLYILLPIKGISLKILFIAIEIVV